MCHLEYQRQVIHCLGTVLDHGLAILGALLHLSEALGYNQRVDVLGKLSQTLVHLVLKRWTKAHVEGFVWSDHVPEFLELVKRKIDVSVNQRVELTGDVEIEDV